MGMEGDYRWDERHNFKLKENKMEFKRISKYDIIIRHTVNGGCIANIGCCEVSFSNTEDLLDALEDYYANPDEIEKKYNAFSKANCIGYAHEQECMPDPEPERRSERRYDEDCCETSRIEHSGNN